MATGTRSCAHRLGSAVSASLVPWAAFLLTSAVADTWVDETSSSLVGLVGASPVYVVFVAAPSALALAAASPGWMRAVVLVVMTGAAIAAGVLVVTSEDAQAGLAVLLVPYVALPLAAAVMPVRLTVGVLWRH